MLVAGVGWPSVRANVLAERLFVWMNGSPIILACEVHAMSQAAEGI